MHTIQDKAVWLKEYQSHKEYENWQAIIDSVSPTTIKTSWIWNDPGCLNHIVYAFCMLEYVRYAHDFPDGDYVPTQDEEEFAFCTALSNRVLFLTHGDNYAKSTAASYLYICYLRYLRIEHANKAIAIYKELSKLNSVDFWGDYYKNAVLCKKVYENDGSYHSKSSWLSILSKFNKLIRIYDRKPFSPEEKKKILKWYDFSKYNYSATLLKYIIPMDKLLKFRETGEVLSLKDETFYEKNEYRLTYVKNFLDYLEPKYPQIITASDLSKTKINIMHILYRRIQYFITKGLLEELLRNDRSKAIENYKQAISVGSSLIEILKRNPIITDMGKGPDYAYRCLSKARYLLKLNGVEIVWEVDTDE